MKIKKGDNVIIIAGKDKGSEGKVLRVFPSASLALVEGVNMKKKHQKARKGGTKGQIVSFAAPMHISNIALKDPKSGKPSRVGYKIEGGKKVRISKKSGAII
ncbi:MAG: 50S ribosomal protein L24 [Patescibacteria group bacterium]